MAAQTLGGRGASDPVQTTLTTQSSFSFGPEKRTEVSSQDPRAAHRNDVQQGTISSSEVTVSGEPELEKKPVILGGNVNRGLDSGDQPGPTRRTVDLPDEECVQGLLDAMLPILASRPYTSGPNSPGSVAGSSLHDHDYTGTGLPAAAFAAPVLQDFAGTGLPAAVSSPPMHYNVTSSVYGIPAPQVTTQRRPVRVETQVIFDLETTGLEIDCHILQLAAVSPKGSFCRYVLPNKPIGWVATLVHGLSFDGLHLHLKGVRVYCVSIRKALSDFLDFLGDQPVSLFAHNAERFDAIVLVNALQACNMLPAFRRKVASFVDTCPLFRDFCPGLPSYKLVNLYRQFFHDSYMPHDAAKDVMALKALLGLPGVTSERAARYSFSLDYILQVRKCSQNKKEMLPSWNAMISSGAISRQMAERASASGLSVNHLRMAYQKDGPRGVQITLSECAADGRRRVTKSKSVIAKVSSYIAQSPVIDAEALKQMQYLHDKDQEDRYNEESYNDSFETAQNPVIDAEALQQMQQLHDKDREDRYNGESYKDSFETAQFPVIDAEALQQMQYLHDNDREDGYAGETYSDIFETFSDYSDDDDQSSNNVAVDYRGQGNPRRRRHYDSDGSGGPDNDLYPEHIQRSKVRRTEKKIKEKPSPPCSCSII